MLCNFDQDKPNVLSELVVVVVVVASVGKNCLCNNWTNWSQILSSTTNEKFKSSDDSVNKWIL